MNETVIGSIYTSRDSNEFLDVVTALRGAFIYTSRDSNEFLDITAWIPTYQIYTSRDSNEFLDKLKAVEDEISTQVEILMSFWTNIAQKTATVIYTSRDSNEFLDI